MTGIDYFLCLLNTLFLTLSTMNVLCQGQLHLEAMEYPAQRYQGKDE